MNKGKWKVLEEPLTRNQKWGKGNKRIKGSDEAYQINT